MPAPASNPRWLSGVQRLEKVVAPQLTEVLHSGRFHDLTGAATKLRRGVDARAEQVSRRVLHLMNLPTGSDVTRLLGEVGRLQNQVRALSVQLDEAKAAIKPTSRAKKANG